MRRLAHAGHRHRHHVTIGDLEWLRPAPPRVSSTLTRWDNLVDRDNVLCAVAHSQYPQRFGDFGLSGTQVAYLGMPNLIANGYGTRAPCRMKVSDELTTVAAVIRVSTMPAAAEIADLLEDTARRVAIRESMWELAGYSEQQQTALAESEWRFTLAMARALGRFTRTS